MNAGIVNINGRLKKIMKMLKQFLCWLKTGHKNRKMDGIPFKKQVDIAEYIWFKPYRCRNCGYKGNERL